jgi:DNA polymerase-3 subunit epsilon
MQTLVIVDLETTGLSSSYDQIIEIGAIKVNIQNWEIHEFFETFSKPESEYHFEGIEDRLDEGQNLTTNENGDRVISFKLDPFITVLTGITDDMLIGAPNNKDAVEAFLSFAGKDTIWAYNAGFDSSFINHFTNEKRSFRDILSLARRAFPEQPSYKLSNLAASLGIEVKNAHRALADCMTSHQVLMQASAKVGFEVQSGRYDFNPKEYQPVADGIFFGKTLVFTGALQVMSRDAAAARASAYGFTIAGGVSKKVHYLVVGIQDISTLAGYEKSSKHRKAEELIALGHHIRILTEGEFLQMCDQS